MDTETIKGVLVFFGGVLAFSGALLTFIHGRLKDAETDRERDRVLTTTLEVASSVLNVVGVLSVLLFSSYLWSIVPFLLALLVRAVLFLRRRGPINRTEVVSLSIVVSSFSMFVAMAVTFHFIGRILDILGNMAK